MTNRRQTQVRTSFTVILLAAIPVLLLFLFFPLVRQGTVPNYLFWHTALQAVTIIMAAQIFTLTLSAYKNLLPTNIIVLGMVSLALAFFGFSHLLLHPDMPQFFDSYYRLESFYFWLWDRLLIAAVILFISLYPWRHRFRIRYFTPGLILLVLLISLLNAVAFYFPEQLALFFGPRQRVKTINLVAGGICLLMLATASVLLFLQRKSPTPKNICTFFTAAGLFFLYELIATFHPQHAELYHIIVHAYKLLALYFLYRAVFAEVVRYPHEELKNSQQRLQATLKASPDLIFEVDEQGFFHRVYTRGESGTDQVAQKFLHKSIEQVLSPEYAHIAWKGLDEARQIGIAQNKIIAIGDAQDQQPTWLELSISHMQTDPGEPERYIAIARDITSRVQENEQLKLLSEAVNHNPSAIYILNKALQIQFVNKAFTRLTGYSSEEALGKTLDIFPSNATTKLLQQYLQGNTCPGEIWQNEIQRIKKNGASYLAEISVYPIANSDGKLINYLLIENDITETRQISEKLQRISNFDRLTGLPNLERLHVLLDHLKQQQHAIAILWINLDHFKNINDALGYQVGDTLLKEVADRLSNLLRPQDILSRPSGDNFVMLLPGAQHNAAARTAQQVLDTLSAPLQTIRRPLVISASIGISMYPWDSKNTSTLLTQAETAMHRMKRDSRGYYCFFKLEMHEKNAQKLILGMALKQAIDHQEFFLVYQPQIDLQTGTVIGVEALLRWQTPFWGQISPALFIPLAEESGDIIEIGRWVITTALKQMRAWQRMQLSIERISINISALQFEQPDFFPFLMKSLKDSGVDPQHLELEITEAVAMKDPELSAKRIEELGAAQIQVAIDDFGKGYSSLNYLKRFDINTIKIDRSFIKKIHLSTDDQAIVNAIITMAYHLGLHTIAEGIETKEELEFMRASDCNAAQGFYFAKPLTAHNMEKFMLHYEFKNFL